MVPVYFKRRESYWPSDCSTLSRSFEVRTVLQEDQGEPSRPELHRQESQCRHESNLWSHDHSAACGCIAPPGQVPWSFSRLFDYLSMNLLTHNNLMQIIELLNLPAESYESSLEGVQQRLFDWRGTWFHRQNSTSFEINELKRHDLPKHIFLDSNE